jgi:hypothetical protein
MMAHREFCVLMVWFSLGFMPSAEGWLEEVIQTCCDMGHRPASVTRAAGYHGLKAECSSVKVDSEVSVVTSLFSRHVGSICWTQSLGDAHRYRVCIHRGECMYVCVNIYDSSVFHKKENL